MKPANGTYRLTSDPQGDPPRRYELTVHVHDTGLDSSLGAMPYHGAPWDFFLQEAADVAIRCLGNGRFVALVRAGRPDEQAYAGDCVLEAP